MAKNRHLGIIAQLCRTISSQLRHASTIGKKVVKQHYLLHMSPQYGKLGPLAAEIVSLVWDAPANFKGFRVLASLLQRRRSTEVNQALHDVWPSPARLHSIYIFGGCCPVTEFFQVQNSVYVLQVLRSPIGGILHGNSSSGREPNFAALSTGIFGRATIAMGIGPHSSLQYFARACMD